MTKDGESEIIVDFKTKVKLTLNNKSKINT